MNTNMNKNSIPTEHSYYGEAKTSELRPLPYLECVIDNLKGINNNYQDSLFRLENANLRFHNFPNGEKMDSESKAMKAPETYEEKINELISDLDIKNARLNTLLHRLEEYI